jgi:peptide/nickel transport system substrate-binding protein
VSEKRVCAIALAALASLCGACARREAPVPATTIFRHLEGDPPTLDPTATNEELGMRVEEMLFRPLLDVDHSLRVVPALASSWSVSPDGLSYEFRLDPEARWEDGSAVTSADVAFTIDRMRDPKGSANVWKAAFEDLAALETPEPSRVIARFRKPYAERLLAFDVPIVSRAAFERNPRGADRAPLASGPYRLESWTARQQLNLVRRADRKKDALPFDRVVFRIIPESAVWFRAGSRGDLDEFRVSRDQRREAEGSPDFQSRARLLRVPQPVVVVVVWNCRNPILADPRVRRALALSWPRAEVARRLYPPDGAALISGPYPAGVPENAPDVPPPSYDPAASARLLDEAGLKPGPDGMRRRGGRPVSLELLYTAGRTMDKNLGEILRDAYGKVGVELVLKSLDWAAYSQRFSAGEFDVLPTANYFLPFNLDPYPYYHSSEAPPKGSNMGFYRNPEADRLMDEAQRELDEARRRELYRSIHRVLASDPPADFLWSADQYWGISRRIEGVQTSPVGLFHFAPGPLGWRPSRGR